MTERACILLYTKDTPGRMTDKIGSVFLDAIKQLDGKEVFICQHCI